MIETFHELGAGERLRDDGGGRETVQLFKDVRRVDDRLAFPARQGLRNLAVLPERDRQDDCVGLECILQRLGDDRGSNRPSLRRQRLGGPATRDGHVDVLTGEGVGEGLTYLSLIMFLQSLLILIPRPSTARLSVPLCGGLRVDVLPRTTSARPG